MIVLSNYSVELCRNVLFIEPSNKKNLNSRVSMKMTDNNDFWKELIALGELSTCRIYEVKQWWNKSNIKIYQAFYFSILSNLFWGSLCNCLSYGSLSSLNSFWPSSYLADDPKDVKSKDFLNIFNTVEAILLHIDSFPIPLAPFSLFLTMTFILFYLRVLAYWGYRESRKNVKFLI